jgi:hypothetical protein
MKKFILLLITIFACIRISYSQNVNGVILSDTGNITIIKVWGTHYERGIAYGYLLGDKIKDIFDGYVKPLFGTYLPAAKQVISQGTSISIDSIYKVEAKAVILGMDSAGTDTTGTNYLDLLVGNSLLDIGALFGVKISDLGCSSLMSWTDATTGTDLDGKSVISRHLDWSTNAHIVNNQIMVINIPCEQDEQPWLLIGFAGQISVLSGINISGISAFQHMMSDFTGNAVQDMGYEPIWFALRKALEKIDFNNDGADNVNDIKDALSSNTNGYADGYIISSLAPSTENNDSLIALIAEIAPQQPVLTFRSNSYADSIPGDNLYTANNEIKRNEHLDFCPRYNAVKNAMGNGINISSAKNWEIMRDSSNSASYNIQFMQVIPEQKILKLAIYKNSIPAYQNIPVTYNLDDLFSSLISIKEKYKHNVSINVFPNPSKFSAKIGFYNNKYQKINLSLFDINGKHITTIINKYLNKGNYIYNINTSVYNEGIYFCKLTTYNDTIYKKIVLIK